MGGFPDDSDAEESACNEGDLGLILGWEDPLEEGMTIHSSIPSWSIPMDRGSWEATVHGVTESDMTEQLSTAISLRRLLRGGGPCEFDNIE